MTVSICFVAELCLKDLNSLASIKLIHMDEDSFDLKASGRLLIGIWFGPAMYGGNCTLVVAIVKIRDL